MNYEEALAYCYLQGKFLADPKDPNSYQYWLSLLTAIDDNERYWFDNGSCRTIDKGGHIETESCEENNKVVCQSERVHDVCVETEVSFCKECFIGMIPELSGGRPDLKNINIEKSFKINFELHCNEISNYEYYGTVVDITLGTKGNTRNKGSFKYEASLFDEILANSSSNVTSRLKNPDRSFTQLYIHRDWIFTQLYDAPGATHVFYENFELNRSILSLSNGIPRMNYYLRGCPGDSWTLFEFKHNLDAETGLWTDMWSIDGVPMASSTYSLDTWTHERNFHLGMSTSDLYEAKTNIRNFCYSSI